jgi:hypothetical protein
VLLHVIILLTIRAFANPIQALEMTYIENLLLATSQIGPNTLYRTGTRSYCL